MAISRRKLLASAAAVGEGRADALVSAGSTGPTLAAATLSVKRIKGVYRPALAVLMPIPGGPVLLLDAGASVEVRPEHLVQFAYMGAGFMEAVVGIDRPSVGAGHNLVEGATVECGKIPCVVRRFAGQNDWSAKHGSFEPYRAVDRENDRGVSKQPVAYLGLRTSIQDDYFFRK